MSGWHNEPMLGLDFETTGVDWDNDRIVQSALVIVVPSQRKIESDVRIINPGIDIPTGASDIHHITTERAKAEGENPITALDHLAEELTAGLMAGWPIVGMNVPFDLTFLDRELRRHGLPTLAQRLKLPVAPVVDVFVMDKMCHPFRKGARNLGALSTHYGVPLAAEDAHDAGADALAACRVAWKIIHWGGLGADHWAKPERQISPRDTGKVPASYQRMAALSLAELHVAQVKAKKQQDEGYAEYLRRQAKTERDAVKKAEMLARADGCHGLWPMIPFEGQQAMA